MPLKIFATVFTIPPKIEEQVERMLLHVLLQKSFTAFKILVILLLINAKSVLTIPLINPKTLEKIVLIAFHILLGNATIKSPTSSKPDTIQLKPVLIPFHISLGKPDK